MANKKENGNPHRDQNAAEKRPRDQPPQEFHGDPGIELTRNAPAGLSDFGKPTISVLSLDRGSVRKRSWNSLTWQLVFHVGKSANWRVGPEIDRHGPMIMIRMRDTASIVESTYAPNPLDVDGEPN